MPPSIASFNRQEQYTDNYTISLPTGTTAGNLLLLCTSSGSQVTNIPSGWTELYNEAVSDEYGRIEARAYWKIAGSNEPNVTIQFSFTSNVTIAILRITGAHATSPIAASGRTVLTSSQSSVAAPSLTPSVGNTLAVTVAHAYYRRHNGTPSGYTSLFTESAWTDGGGNGFMRAAYAAGPAANTPSASPSWPCIVSSLYQIAGHILVAPPSTEVTIDSATLSLSGSQINSSAVQVTYVDNVGLTLSGNNITSGGQPTTVVNARNFQLVGNNVILTSTTVVVVQSASLTLTANSVTLTSISGVNVASAEFRLIGNNVVLGPPPWLRQPGEQYAYILRISHPALDTPICLIGDSHPIEIDGDVYQPWPIAGTTPVRHTATGEAQIDVCIVDRSAVAALHAAHTGDEEPIVEFGAVDLARYEVFADRAVGRLVRLEWRSQTEATLVMGPLCPLEQEPLSITFTPGRFPALFRG